jgi:hypothetical protein
LWTTLFDRFSPLDAKGLFAAYLDLVFEVNARRSPARGGASV